MSDAVWISLISAAGSLLTVALGLLNSVMAKRNENHVVEVKAAVVETKERMAILERQTNSIKDELVGATDKAAFARGVKSETDKKEGA